MDVTIDTPASIAIVGAGPVGLEAGLYARYLGYQVTIYESQEVATNVLRWGHVAMLNPFAQLGSALGLAAVRTQDTHHQTPAPDAQLTGHQWVEAYLRPLSRTDLLADHISTGTTVTGVARTACRKTDALHDAARYEDRFCLLLESADAGESIAQADVVIDATGVYGQPNWCGRGGLPARGERQLRDKIEYGIPDVLGAQRSRYESRHTLIVGSDIAAAHTILSLAALASENPQTRVTWVTQYTEEGGASAPIPLAAYQGCPAQLQLATAANQSLEDTAPGLTHRGGVWIDALEFDTSRQQFLVWLNDEPDPLSCDQIVANMGYRGDLTWATELQLRTDSRTGGPAGVGEHLSTVDRCKDAHDLPPTRLLTGEPHFYILGAKSYGRDGRFQFSDGLRQIRDLFALIGGRAELDLYATMRND